MGALEACSGQFGVSKTKVESNRGGRPNLWPLCTDSQLRGKRTTDSIKGGEMGLHPDLIWRSSDAAPLMEQRDS